MPGNFPRVQIAALSARTPRSSLVGPEHIATIARNAGHDAAMYADRGLAAGLPAAIAGARDARLPLVCGVWVDVTEHTTEPPHVGPPIAEPAHVLVWAKTATGIRNLARLSTIAMSSERHPGRVRRRHLQDLDSDHNGLLAARPDVAEHLEGAAHAIGILRNAPAARTAAASRSIEHRLRTLAHDFDIPAIGICPWTACAESQRDALQVLYAIARNATFESAADRLPARISILDRDALEATFADTPELLDNAAWLATSACAIIAPGTAPMVRPDTTAHSEHSELVERATRALEQRLHPRRVHETYAARLTEELDIIRTMAFSSLFLVVADLVAWTRAQGWLVGPGRGSAAGSLVSWALRITDVDPIGEHLLFSRFLTVRRRAAPDFDLDLEPAHRDAIIAKLAELWGPERTAPIAAWGMLRIRQAMRSSMRARGVPHPTIGRIIDQLAPRIHDVEDNNSATTLEDFIAEGPPAEFKGNDRARTETAMHDTRHLVHGVNNITRHASAIALYPEPVDGPFALIRQGHGPAALQVDHDEAERFGAAKIDCLGLETMSIIQRAQGLAGDPDLPWTHDVLPIDTRAYARLAAGETRCIFQLGGDGITRTAHDMHVRSYADVRDVIALFRPGPMDQIPEICARRAGLSPATPPHPALEHLLEETSGIIIYQEQAMAAAQLIAGFDDPASEALRRAISKKKPQELEPLRHQFFNGARQTHPEIAPEQITQIWNNIERQSGYAFNRSHSAGYAVITRATARLREAAPAALFAAQADSDAKSGEDTLRELRDAAAAEGIRFLPPDPARPRARCTPHPDARHIESSIALLPGAGDASVAQWAGSGDDPQRSDPDTARAWMHHIGLADTLIHAIEQARNPHDPSAWIMWTPEVLPSRTDRTALTVRGRLDPLARAWTRPTDPECDPPERIRALAYVERIRGTRTITLSDGDARVRARLDEHSALASHLAHLEGRGVIATIDAGTPPRIEHLEPWTDAELRWPGALRLRLTSQAAHERAPSVQHVLEGFQPGSGTVVLEVPNEHDRLVRVPTSYRIRTGPELVAALRAVLEPHAPECDVECFYPLRRPGSATAPTGDASPPTTSGSTPL